MIRMLKLFTVIFFIAVVTINSQPITGNKIIRATAGDYPTLAAAFTAINTNGVSGHVTLLIDENLNEEGINLILTRNDFTSTNRVTIRPNVGRTVSLTITNFSLSGTIEQGLSFTGSSFVTIDGSNAVGGSTRNLTIIGNDATATQAYLIAVSNNTDNVVIRNTNIFFTAIPSNTSAIAFSGSSDGTLGAPDNILVDNCEIGEPTRSFRNGISMFGNNTVNPTSGTLSNNIIYSSRRAITSFHIARNIYRGNTLYIVNPAPDQVFYSGIYITGSVTNDTTLVENNRILRLDMAAGATVRYAGGIVIWGNTGVINIVNNFICGNSFNFGTNLESRIYGIVFGSATWNGIANIIYNTIRIDTSSSTGRHAAIGWETNSNATLNITNNIFFNARNIATSFIIHYPVTPGPTSVLNSNNNNYFVSGPLANIGFWGSAATPTLANWQTASGKDANSDSRNVTFVSDTDLHLAGTSVADLSLVGIPISWIPRDIDGQLRHTFFPYMGADERPDFPLPVELTSFTALAQGNSALLNWATATELNNKGFEIQRKDDNSNWISIGFVSGKGTTTSVSNYSFVDKNLFASKFYYRLIQIDLDGTSTMSNVVEVDISGPSQFSLEQNFPNPFNANTVIRFQIGTRSEVTLRIYDALGKEVTTLIDGEIKDAGIYDANFNAADFPSGVYFYTLQAGNYVATKKLVLMK
ncbi:MAG: hypothetical protein C0425_09350 [Chlorobiaceae bacterium]|nr:hypothetical protein [Chlorobiaceae bacterium]